MPFHCLLKSSSAVHACDQIFRMHLIPLNICILCHTFDAYSSVPYIIPYSGQKKELTGRAWKPRFQSLRFCGQNDLDCMPPKSKHMLDWHFCYKTLKLLCKSRVTHNFSEKQDLFHRKDFRTSFGRLGAKGRICSADEQWLAAGERAWLAKMQLTLLLFVVAVVSCGMTSVIFPEETEAGECLPLRRCCHLARVWRERHQRQAGI